jgi:hypothetical protein
MSVVYPGETVTLLFAPQDPRSGEALPADALPTATLVRGGVAAATVVSVAALETGLYRATATLPGDAAVGEWWEIAVSATVSGIPAKAALKIGRSEARRIEPFFDASGRVDVGRLLGQPVELSGDDRLRVDVATLDQRSLEFSSDDRLRVDVATLAEQAVALSAANRLQVDLQEIVGSASAATDLAAGAPRLDANVSSRSSHAPADVRAAMDASSTKLAEILAGVATLTDEPLAEIASIADVPPEPTLRQALMLVYMWLRNDSQASATLRRIVDAAGAPVLEADLADDGTTFSQGTLRSPE